MTEVVMYTKTYCGFCAGARRLLEKKGVRWEEINLDEQPARLGEMVAKAEGRRTVPQIFIDGKAVGGYDDIAELDYDGKLDTLLGINGN